ncbi:unnamed protein product [Rotaria sp. Silwood1]|nr:unnamed protein product [Rotaria sp. Silwood1]CAF4540218.1 unnamed protein product [Rotaria sp. Silwood1]
MINNGEFPSDLSDTKGQKKSFKTDSIIYIDNNKENDLIQFISKAQQQGFNCLDLSKRNIKEFPSQLLDFTTLQYLYLEGNQLVQLPNDLFTRLKNLKWLDLRNNQLTSIPSDDLAKHNFLQYLLLSGNHLQTLPCELGKVKTLSALNLDGNPLIHPPFEIIKQGIKAIQQYLRDKFNENDKSISSDDNLDDDEEVEEVEEKDNDDDDDDDDDDQHRTKLNPRHRPSLPNRKSKSETSYYETATLNLLPAHLQSCLQFKRMTYSAIRPSPSIRSRPQSEMRLSQMKTKTITNKNNDPESDIYITQERPFTQSRHRNIRVDEEIQQLYTKSFNPSKEFEEPIVHTPFHIDAHFAPIVNKNQLDMKRYERRRSYLPKYSINENEENFRRMRDQQIQDRIRQITDKMLKRRFEARQSLFEEKRQVRLELRELRKLESAGTQHRPISQMNNRSKTSYDHVNVQKKL